MQFAIIHGLENAIHYRQPNLSASLSVIHMTSDRLQRPSFDQSINQSIYFVTRNRYTQFTKPK